MKDYQKWVDRVRDGPGKLLVEQKFGLTEDFQATQFFAGNVWYRGIGDVLRIDGPVALGLDWKTGKVLHDSRQLMLMSQCIFSHYPKVRVVRAEFVWLKEDCTTPEIFYRDKIINEWPPVLDQVQQMKDAARTMTYPPKPGRLCRSYCPVVSCPYHGKSTR